MPSAEWFDSHPDMDEHERTCEHCRSFRRKVADEEFAVATEEVACRRCGCIKGVRDERYVFARVSSEASGVVLVRCAQCGTPRGEDHIIELAWAELPDSGLATGWGGVDVWSCSPDCGAWEGDDDLTMARAHATAVGGTFLPPLPSSHRSFSRTDE